MGYRDEGARRVYPCLEGAVSSVATASSVPPLACPSQAAFLAAQEACHSALQVLQVLREARWAASLVPQAVASRPASGAPCAVAVHHPVGPSLEASSCQAVHVAGHAVGRVDRRVGHACPSAELRVASVPQEAVAVVRMAVAHLAANGVRHAVVPTHPSGYQSTEEHPGGGGGAAAVAAVLGDAVALALRGAVLGSRASAALALVHPMKQRQGDLGNWGDREGDSPRRGAKTTASRDG